MSLFDRYLHVIIVSAEPEDVLNKLIYAGVELIDIAVVDLLTVRIRISKNQYHIVQKILQGNGASGKIVKKEGFLWYAAGLEKRPVLIVGVLLFALSVCIVPRSIFFVRVSGNENIPDKMILSQAEECGIRFGSRAAEVRSEKVKNQLLAKLPELQWVGVNTSGCVATIQVKERSLTVDAPKQKNAVSSLVAARDGIITQITVQKGTSLIFPGQAVEKGDVLISGYTDCGIKVQAENATGEVMAHTMRQNIFVAMQPTVQRGDYIGRHYCYRLQIGKKVINLCNHSGIPDATCVKMYLEDYWTLPGDFQLPVSLIKVSCLFYERVTADDYAEELENWLPQFSRDYLQRQMVAGEILEEDIRFEFSEDIFRLIGNYACHEMIGQVKYEEKIEQNAEDN